MRLFKWKNKQMRLARKIPKKEGNKEGLTLVCIEAYYKAAFMKKVIDTRAVFKLGGIGLAFKKGKF